MTSPAPSIERAALYEAVWETPIVHLARTLGVPGAEVKRACEALDVPMPSQGHWTRIRHGHDVKRAPLPDREEGSPAEYTFRQRVAVSSPASKSGQKSIGNVSGLPDTFQPPPEVKVPATLRNPHPLVARTRTFWDAVDARRPGSYDSPSVKGDLLDVQVSKAHRPRALRIMQAVLKAAEAVGYGVASGKDRFAVLEVEGEEVPFRIRERNRQ